MRKIMAQEIFEEMEFQINRLRKEKLKNATATSKVGTVNRILEVHQRTKG